jgi:hypothetical protein
MPEIEYSPRVLHLPVMVLPHDLVAFECPDSQWREHVTDIHRISKTGLQVTDVELMTFGMFHEWDYRLLGYRTHRDLESRARERWPFFRDYVDMEHGVLRLRRDPASDIVERLGVATSLALVSKVLGLTEADFEKIPVSSVRKSLDYSVRFGCATPQRICEVEAKGTHDNKSTSGQIQDIRAKKAAPNQRKADLRLGVVADVAKSSDRDTKLILVDPPAEGSDATAYVLKLLIRLRFYLRQLLMFTKGHYGVALANRLVLLEAARSSGWRTARRSTARASGSAAIRTAIDIRTIARVVRWVRREWSLLRAGVGVPERRLVATSFAGSVRMCCMFWHRKNWTR